MKRIQQMLGTVALVAMLLPLAQPVQAQLKIGYANPDAIVQSMPEYRQMMQTLQNEVQITQQALASLAQDFQEAVAKYQKQQPLLSAERQQQREAELAQMQQEIVNAEQQKQQEIAVREQEMLAPLLERVNTAIEDVANEKQLDMIFRTASLLFVDDDKIIDVTLDVARKLGIEVDEEAAADPGAGASSN